MGIGAAGSPATIETADVGAIAGLVSLAVAVLVGDMGGSLAVTANALRLARIRSTV